MNVSEPSTSEDDPSIESSISPADVSFLEYQKKIIREQTNSRLHKPLTDHIQRIFDVDQSEMAKRSIENLIQNAVTLKNSVEAFELEMTPYGTTALMKEYLKTFWEDFIPFNPETLTSQYLDPKLKALHKIFEETKLEYENIAKFKEKALEKAKTDLDRDLQNYFPQNEIDAWYEKLDEVSGNENAVKAWRQEVMKARNIKQKYIKTFIKKYNQSIGTPTSDCRTELDNLLELCGSRSFYERHPEVSDIESRLIEAENIESQAVDQFETLNEQYEAITGSSLDIPEIAAHDDEPPEVQEEIARLTEKNESREQAAKVVERLRARAMKSVKFWGPKATSEAHAIRSVFQTETLLKNQATNDSSYTWENYEAEFKSAAEAGVPINKKNAVQHGVQRPEVFFNIASDPDEFTGAMAARAEYLLNVTSNLSEQFQACASLFYVDFHHDGRAEAPAPSIHNFVGTCTELIKKLRGGTES